MMDGQPNISEVITNSATASGTVVTVPAGKWFTGDWTLAGSISVAGNCNPTFSISGSTTDQDGVFGRINITGLALVTVSDSLSGSVIVKAPDSQDATIVFTAGASGVSSGTINGFLFG